MPIDSTSYLISSFHNLHTGKRSLAPSKERRANRLIGEIEWIHEPTRYLESRSLTPRSRVTSILTSNLAGRCSSCASKTADAAAFPAKNASDSIAIPPRSTPSEFASSFPTIKLDAGENRVTGSDHPSGKPALSLPENTSDIQEATSGFPASSSSDVPLLCSM